MDHTQGDMHYILIVILVVVCALFVLNTVTLGQFIVVVALLAVIFYMLGLHLTK